MTPLIERFLRYVSMDTQSDPESPGTPSTDKQWELARSLAEELEQLGLQEVSLDDKGYLMATLPSNVSEQVPTIGFISHYDTSPDFSGANVKPRIVRDYQGDDIVLHSKKGIVLSPRDFPELLDYKGQSLIVTDGTTLLGADDKAGIAEILTAMAYLVEHPGIPHGRIRVGFTPDEEIGRGAHHFDVKAFGAQWAYTVDGSTIGELEYENFNAAKAQIRVRGRSVHPGYAKDKMINAINVLRKILDGLPDKEAPEYTEKQEGFFHIHDLKGQIEDARAELIIRDHDRELFEHRKRLLSELVESAREKYQADIRLEIEDQYYNMKEKILPVFPIVTLAEEAMESVGVQPIVKPIRGGTDGSQLSFKGLPCPNIFAGGHNFHGKYEYIPIPSMEKAVEVIVKICELTATKPQEFWKKQPK